MPAPGIALQLLDGRQAAEHAAELQALHAEVYAEVYADLPDGGLADAPPFAERFRVQRRGLRPSRGSPRRLSGRLRLRDAAAARYLLVA